MVSVWGWFWIIYISTGLIIMMEALVESWTWPDYSKSIKIIGGIVSVLFWPLVFFMD